MKPALLALSVTLYASAFDYGIAPAFSAAFCVELTAAEFNHRAERRGDDNACAGRGTAKTRTVARDQARLNAINAIAAQCTESVTVDIAQQACARTDLVLDVSADTSWVDATPAPKPGAEKVRYLGHGTAGVNLCANARDGRIRTRNVVDGHCPHSGGRMPHRTFAIARASARCAVVCRTP